MASLPGKVDRQTTTPFLLKVFYKEGSFPPLTDFHSSSTHTHGPTSNPLPHLTLYTWHSCTLHELAHLISYSHPDLLSTPSIGTRLAFRLVFPDTRSTAGAAGISAAAPALSLEGGKFLQRDLGSVVLGADGAVAADNDDNDDDDGGDREAKDVARPARHAAAGGEHALAATATTTTLKDFRFVIGDYISMAILAPLPNGNVAPPPMLSGAGVGGGGLHGHHYGYGVGIEGGGGGRDHHHHYQSHHHPHHGHQQQQQHAGFGGRAGGGAGSGRGTGRERENGFGGGGGFRGGRGRGGGGWGGGGSGLATGGPRGVAVPSGEWRRGERLPDGPPGGSRSGYGGGRGRDRW